MERFFIQDGKKHEKIKLHVGTLPSGTVISVKANVYNADSKGPKVLIIGGMHGDEVNGVEIVRRLLFDGIFEQLLCGTVLAIPILNVYGFINFSRDTPDGKDVNRSFPGSTSGSLSYRVARAISKEILPDFDIVIDLHTGGAERFNYPQIRYTPDDAKARELAGVFGTDIVVEKKTIAKSLRQTARKLGKTVLVFEGGESLRYDKHAIQTGYNGIIRILTHLGMKKGTVPNSNPILVQHTTWVRAAKAGLFQWIKKSGDKVTKKEIIGKIYDPFGEKVFNIISSKHGVIIGHQNKTVVGLGEPLFNIGYEI